MSIYQIIFVAFHSFDLINDLAVYPLCFLKIASIVFHANQCALYHRSTCCLENERATFCRSVPELLKRGLTVECNLDTQTEKKEKLLTSIPYNYSIITITLLNTD